MALGDLQPDQVIVQAVYGKVDSHNTIAHASTTMLRLVGIDHGRARYEGDYRCEESGVQGCTVRVLPTHPTLAKAPDAFKVTYANGAG